MLDAGPVLRWLRERFPTARGFCVAYSGGGDSTALLALLQSNRADLHAPLRALHIQHDLHPDAPQWAHHCARQARALDVPLSVRTVRVVRRGGGVEADARDARYEAFVAELHSGEVLLQAHHQHDQAETLLLRLMRGAGPDGLAAIPAVRRLGAGWLARPVLDASPRGLRGWLSGLEWIEDPANADPALDRVYLRSEVLPLLQARWPEAIGRLASSSRWLREARERLQTQARADLHASLDGGRPRVSQLPSDPGRARAAIRLWIAAYDARMPEQRALEEALSQWQESASDRLPELRWPDGCIRRYRGRLYWVRPSGRKGAEPQQQATARTALHTLLTRRCTGVWGVVGGAPSPGPGIAVDTVAYADEPVWWWGVRSAAPAGRLGAVKRRMQRAGVPPWERDSTPLLWCGSDPVAVPGYWLDPAWASDPGWRLVRFAASNPGC